LKLAYDKKLHIIAGLLVAVVSHSLTESLWVAFIASLVVGAAKEAYDATGRGTVDLWDFVATAAGGLLFVGILLVS
jgi:ABC-type xylose transport system permease subunit